MEKPIVDIRALAQLVRLGVSDEEVAEFEKEMPAILGFVNEIGSAGAAEEAIAPKLRNVIRQDTDAHASGAYTKQLLEAAPAKKNDRIVVKQVVSRQKSGNRES